MYHKALEALMYNPIRPFLFENWTKEVTIKKFDKCFISVMDFFVTPQ